MEFFITPEKTKIIIDKRIESTTSNVRYKYSAQAIPDNKPTWSISSREGVEFKSIPEQIYELMKISFDPTYYKSNHLDELDSFWGVIMTPNSSFYDFVSITYNKSSYLITVIFNDNGGDLTDNYQLLLEKFFDQVEDMFNQFKVFDGNGPKTDPKIREALGELNKNWKNIENILDD